MSIMSRVSTIFRANVNDVLTKTENMQSLPIVEQHIRDVEVALSEGKHNAAAAAANVITLQRQRTDLANKAEENKQRALAYKNKGDEANAKATLSLVVSANTQIANLDIQINNAKEASTHMDAAVDQLDERHTTLMNQLTTLRSQDANAHALQGMTKSLQQAAELTNNVDVANSVDNISQRIQAKSDEAQVEFDRTVSSFAPAHTDPLHEAAVDDLFAQLGNTNAAAAGSSK